MKERCKAMIERRSIPEFTKKCNGGTVSVYAILLVGIYTCVYPTCAGK